MSTKDLAQNSTSFHLSLIEDKDFNISLKLRQYKVCGVVALDNFQVRYKL